jgi:tight adherence protein B
VNELIQALLLGALVAGLGIVIYLWRRIHILEVTRARLRDAESPAAAAQVGRDRPFVRPQWLLPWLLAVLVGAALYYFAHFASVFAVTFAIVAGLLATQWEVQRVVRARLRIEEQLADALALMVAALYAGAGAVSALEASVREARRPLRPQLDELLGRIRLGDDAQTALRALEARVPLETFRLFASALSVHWETGGSLTRTLATVGRVIRDRIEVNRRIRTLTSQARTSTMAVLLVTYFIALVIWRNDPARMREFLATMVGQVLAAAAIGLQAVGLVWASALSRMKY